MTLRFLGQGPQDIAIIIGLSSDTKPENGEVCGLFLETDANKFYRWYDEWIEIPMGGSGAWGNITGTLSDQTDLQSALNGKSNAGHHHDSAYSPTGHDHDADYAPIVHTHPASEISDSTAVGRSVVTAANQAAARDAIAAEPANSNIQTHVAQAHAPADAQKNSDITKAEIEAKLTGEISTHTHAGGGSDPWTYLRLASDFTTTSATAVDVTGLAFTPAANARYEFEAVLFCRTATATVGPRPGLAWPTGMSDGVASVRIPSAAGTEVQQHGNIGAAILAPVGGLPNTTSSYRGRIEGAAIAGASPSGTVRVQLASETAGTTVTAKAGSFLKYRTIP